jgi:hypothetical protein
MQKNYILGARQDAQNAANESRPGQHFAPQPVALVPGVVLAVEADGYTVTSLDESGNQARTFENVVAYPEGDFSADEEVVLVFSPGVEQPWIFTGGGGCSHGLTAFGVITD